MTTLYVDRKDIELQVSGGALVFRETKGRRGSIPIGQLERVVLRGRVQLSTSVLGAIAEAGAGVLMLSGRHSRSMATCVGRPHNDVLRRLGQFDAYQDAATRVDWAAGLVSAKLRAQSRLLKKAQGQRPDKRRQLTRAIDRLRALEFHFSADAGTPGISSLLGIEGAAAAAYFAGLSPLFPPSLGFQSRNRRPPKDPVNACLSLGYTLLHFEAVMACHAVGLDPMLGLFHEPAYGRESLAADVIEPFRPHIDEWVWSLFRGRVLTVRDFHQDGEAILLGKAGRQRFYQQVTPLTAALRRLLRRQLARAAREFEQRGRNCQSLWATETMGWGSQQNRNPEGLD